MPRINAPTVREHHEQVMTSLIDAAEQILREEGPGALTAGAVSSRAGVARNSIYRYVESIDDLRGLVVERYMPGWFDAVQEAMGRARPDWAWVALESAATKSIRRLVGSAGVPRRAIQAQAYWIRGRAMGT